MENLYFIKLSMYADDCMEGVCLLLHCKLQKCQNNALRFCTKTNLADHVRIDDLHSRCKIVSLDQRRGVQLLLLMYKRVRMYHFIKYLLEILVRV